MSVSSINLSFSEASSLFTSPFAQPTTARKVAAVAIFISLTVVTFGIYAIGFFILNKWRDRVTSPEASTISFIPPLHLSPLAGAGARTAEVVHRLEPQQPTTATRPLLVDEQALPTGEGNAQLSLIRDAVAALEPLRGGAAGLNVPLDRALQIGYAAIAQAIVIEDIHRTARGEIPPGSSIETLDNEMARAASALHNIADNINHHTVAALTRTPSPDPQNLVDSERMIRCMRAWPATLMARNIVEFPELARGLQT